MQVKVKSRFVKIGPRKIRRLTSFLKNLSCLEALDQLQFSGLDAARHLMETIKSGISAARDKDMDTNLLRINEIICNEGPALKRRRLCSKGRSTTIKKRMSHIVLTISDQSKSSKTKSVKGNYGSKS